jgi:ribonuclease PH
MRGDGRKLNELRPVEILPEALRYAEGSVEIRFGYTRLICSASVETNVPKWLQGSGQGWVTAEYGMLPRSTHSRISREKASDSGRTQEISRLISRSLRAAVDLKALGERQIIVDCDVLQADGGTRTAAITGGFTALALALEFMRKRGDIKQLPLKRYVSAISVGLVGPSAMLDLCYDEDFSCGTDMNFVMTDQGEFVEIQGTGEGATFSREQMNQMTDLATLGCKELFRHQNKIVGDILPL